MSATYIVFAMGFVRFNSILLRALAVTSQHICTLCIAQILLRLQHRFKLFCQFFWLNIYLLNSISRSNMKISSHSNTIRLTVYIQFLYTKYHCYSDDKLFYLLSGIHFCDAPHTCSSGHRMLYVRFGISSVGVTRSDHLDD